VIKPRAGAVLVVRGASETRAVAADDRQFQWAQRMGVHVILGKSPLPYGMMQQTGPKVTPKRGAIGTTILKAASALKAAWSSLKTFQ